MDISTIRSFFTVLIFAIFIGIWIWAWSGKRKKDFDEAANLPFADEEKMKPMTERRERTS